MFIKISSLNLLPVILFLCIAGCVVASDGYDKLTHVASLKNIGTNEVVDAVLFFGSGGYKMGIIPPDAEKNISRTGNSIPDAARAEWHRSDGSIHKGEIRIKKPKEMDKRERYIIQIDDNNKLSLCVEIPKPLPALNK